MKKYLSNFKLILTWTLICYFEMFLRIETFHSKLDFWRLWILILFLQIIETWKWNFYFIYLVSQSVLCSKAKSCWPCILKWNLPLMYCTIIDWYLKCLIIIRVTYCHLFNWFINYEYLYRLTKSNEVIIYILIHVIFLLR